MKTYIKIKQLAAGITFLCLLAGLGACTDFLEEKPNSSITANQYFTEPGHARAAVNALYRRGFPELYNAGGAYAGPNIMLGGYISGLFDNEYKGQELYVKLCQDLDITPQNAVGARMDDIWDPCYNAISRANNAIKYIPETPGLSSDETTYLLAQAKFFRALNYFHLVKFFGDVPLFTEPYESLENLYVARTPSTEVYKLIEEDLTAAVAGLNDEAFTENFHITKHTANALLAKVYLQWSGFPLRDDHYAAAAAAARAVITGGKHSLAQAAGTFSAYNVLRTEDKNPEIVYAMEYNAGIADGGWWPSYAVTGSMEGKLFVDYWVIMKNVYGIDSTSVVFNAYETTDKRIEAGQFFYDKYTIGTVTYDFNRICNWFYFEDAAMLSGAKASKDKPIIRYAEVLLTAAEAIAASPAGVTAEAEGYLNDVRSRAGLPDVSELGKDAFIKAVWTERLREFPLEFKVWDDIQRTRQYPKASDTDPGNVTWTDVIGTTNPWGATFQEKHLLWPVSANEIQRNPQLTQNIGY
jgi:hypothetical protein